jgi:peptide deformylase
VAVREVILIGDPILRRVARPLTPQDLGSPSIRALVEDMADTMHELGGIGIAAPQVGESLQLAIVEITEASTRYPNMPAFGLTVVVNPRVTVLDEAEQAFWEGCLSIPDLRGVVHRPRRVRVDYTDLDNRPQCVVAEGFLATVFQHELDHLQGALFVDKVRDPTTLSTVRNYQRYWLDEPDQPREI